MNTALHNLSFSPEILDILQALPSNIQQELLRVASSYRLDDIQSAVRINPIFYPFVSNAPETRKPICLIYGGRGSGKSRAVAQRIISQALQTPTRFALVRKVGDTIRDSQYRELFDLVSSANLDDSFKFLSSPLMIRCKNNDSIILTRGLDKSSKIKSLANVDFIWVEEAEELTLKDWEDLSLSVRGRTSDSSHNHALKQIVLTFNPVRNHWIRDIFFNPQDNSLRNPNRVYALRSTYKDNFFLDADFSEKLNELKTRNESLYRMYALGEFVELENRIFERLHISDFIDNIHMLQCVAFGADFGFNDPSTLVLCAANLETREIFVKEFVYAKRITEEEFAARCYEEMRKASIEYSFNFMSKAIHCDSAKPSAIECLRRQNLNAVPVSKKSATTKGFRYDAAQLLMQFSIHISSDSENAKREFYDYCWQTHNGIIIDEPVDYNDHTVDAAKYWAWSWKDALLGNFNEPFLFGKQKRFAELLNANPLR